MVAIIYYDCSNAGRDSVLGNDACVGKRELASLRSSLENEEIQMRIAYHIHDRAFYSHAVAKVAQLDPRRARMREKAH